ncbi:hypothetical protein WR25_21949 [Diploscapter pachys]|uniref:TRPM SLOG domain-containing protein n=1 Tax=Diploscapter pachys TaxID=2018661 RepID=A0A2A2K583_9BILA|nr:hypothetical protein WR25_21949 [Diploscapter pachys]
MSQLRRTPASPRSVRSEQRQQLLLREEDEHDEYDVFHPTPMPNQQRAEAIPMDYLSLHVDVGMGGGDSGREIGEPLEREAHQQQSQIGPTRRRLHRRRRSGSFTGEAWPRKARRLHGYSIPPPNVHSTDWRDMIAITDSRPLRLFSQLSYKGNDTDSSPFPPALMRMSSSDLALNRIHWIKENFSRRECAKFVPTNRDPNKCGCGRLRSAHIDIPSIRGISTVNSPSPAVGIILQKVDENNKLITEQSTIRRTGRSVGERWSLRKHTVSLPTDAFGQIEFQGGPHPQKAQYARLSFDTEPSKIMSLFENVWRIAPPRLIITVHGGTNNFDLQPKLARVFRKGLLKAATTTGAWIFTSGVDTGVMRHVAAALEGGSSMSRNKIVCIGISPWGLLKKRDELKGDDMVVPYYPIPTKGRFTTLNNRNNYFLLVDNGTVGRYGAESILRKRLETYIAQKQKIFGGTRSVPVVAVVLEGGSCTIRSVLDYVTNIPRVPVVVCDGSGRAADLLSFTHQVIRDDGSLPDGIRPQLLELVEEVFSCGSPGAEKIVSDLISCAQYKNLITVFRLGEKDRQDVDHAILTALLKGQNLSAADQLSLALAWNRVDIARSDIFTVGQEWSQSALHSAMLEALIHDRVDFVRLLLENGVNMQRFLTFDKLESLYNTDKGPTNTLYYIARDVVRIRRGYHYILPHIGLVIEKLMGNAYKSQYTTHGFKKKYSQFMDKNKTHIRNLRTASKKKSEAMLNRQYTDPAIQIAQSFANSFNGVGPPPGTETNSSIHSEPMLANSGSKALSHHLLWRSAYRREQSSIYPVPTRCTLMDATQEGSELDDESTTGGSEGWKTEEYTFRYPFSELLLWAVLTKRQNMALCLWHHGEEAMAKALVACRLYKSLAAEAAEDYLEVEIREDLRKYADEFRTLSLELLDQCYKQDDTQTLQLLTYELENWSNQTCLSLAVFCNNKQFLAHPSCQILLADLWHGGLRIRSHSNVKVIGGIVFPVSIALMEFKTKDELLNQPQTAMEHESDLNDTPSSTSDSSSSSGDSSSSSFEDEEDDDRRSRRSRKQSVGSVTSLTFSGLFHSKKKKKKEESTSGAKSGEYGTFDGGERAAPIARSRHTSARPHNHNQTPNEKKKINVATISNSQSSLNVFDPYSMSLDVFPQLLPIAPRKRPISFARKLYEFYSAPITTFWLWASSYVLFLALFTYVLLIRTTKHVTILEWIIFTYVVAFGLEHFRRLIMNNEMRSFKQKCLHFFSNFWNTITVLAVGLYLIGFSLRATVSPSYGRVILACDSVLWTLKILDYMSVHHRLGPYVTMAGKMVLNMIYIIIMLFVCLLAFGLARQSITYPNEEWHWILLRNIFYKPYFMLYGEVYADEIDTCGDEAWDSHLENGVPVHIQTNSTSTCPPGFWIPPILMTIFLLVANILLMSMLIAIFNNIFVATDAVAKEIWLFERYRQVMEYESTPFLPPPLTPIYYVHMMIKYFRHDRKNIFDFSLKLFLTPDQVEKLHDFEEDCMEDLHREKKEKKYMSNEERISRTADRTEAILGRLNDASLKDAVNRETLVGLEERLNNMERMQV